MNYRVFSLPAFGDEAAELSLNEFLARHKIIQVDRQFIEQGGLSYWSLCVGYQSQSVSTSVPAKKARVDYKEVLNEEEFAIYAALRELRKQQAEKDGIPVFGVFTNEQLAIMVQKKIKNAAQLKSINGVGDSKLTRYGEVFLKELNRFWNTGNA